MVVILLAVFCCTTIRAFGQAVGASLNGQVTDSTGAAIPGANITAKNDGTGHTQTVTSSGQGLYRIAPLPPGSYSITIQAAGFQAYLQQGIIIAVDTPSTQNVVLNAGGVQQTVTVSSNAEVLNTTSGALGQTINEVEVSQLPLNGRQPSTLVYLAPGMTAGGNTYNQTGFSFPDATPVSANGGNQGSAYFLLDGVPNMDTYIGTAAPFPNADATQEFRVITNNFNAAYGFAPGAVISIATKSGTNSVHGGLFDFYRDRIFNAKNYFSHDVDPLHQNQFGAYAGGPIFKNKLFIFGNYQGTRNATASTELNSYLPTPAMLNGDFSALSTNGAESMCTSGSSSICPFGVVNGKPNQLLPGYSYNPTAVTVATTALPTGQQPNGLTYYTSAPFIAQYDEGTGRLDYDISQSQQLFLRTFIRKFIQPSGDVPGNLLAMNNNYNYDFSIQEEYYNETLGHTWTISPTMVNVASVFWTQLAAHNGSQATTSNGQPFCWSKYINITELPGSCYVEGFSVSGDGFNVGYYEPSQEERTTYGLYDDLTKTWGKHTLSVGANIQHQFAEELTQYPTQPVIAFNGQYTGVGLADFLLGDLSSMFQGAGEVADVAGWQPGFYGQDQYRMKPNLTITAGLRWDPNIPPKIANGRSAAFVPGQQSTVYPNAPVGLVFPGDAGIGGGLMRTTYGYWEPRIGVAWQPRGFPNTSVHAGFGLFTSPMIYSQYNHTADNAPFAPTFNLQGTSTSPLNLNDPWAGFSGTAGVSPFPPFASSSFRPPPTATFAAGLSIPATIDPGFKLGVTQSWNASVEQQINQNMVLRLAYVGSQTYHAPFILDRNPGIYANAGSRSTFSAFGEILDTFSYGTANYNALQVSLERRLSHNLQFQSSFSWSRTTDLASSANISFGTNQLGDPFDLGWSHGISSENVPLRFVANVIYTTPSLRGHNQLMQQVLGGWEISAIVTAQSGFPFSVTGGFGGNESNSLQDEDRADVVSGQSINTRQGGKAHWLNNYFNINAFMENAPGTFGNTGKNIIQAPPLDFTDAGLFKNWTFERYALQFRWEMFNALNQPSFAAPGATNQISSSGVNIGGSEGQITSTGSEPARVGQMALKFTF
jgi:hypothetical protein